MLMLMIAVLMVGIIIVMMLVAVAAAIGATLRLKGCFDTFELGPETLQHLFDHMIRPDVEGTIANLGWKVPISKMPGEPH